MTEDTVGIEAEGLTKRYGRTLAVDRLSFQVRPGQVTGFLGPNGAGKSTTMRMIMGLDGPDAGRARINGKDYHQLRWPLREVGTLLEAKAFHPGRSARSHLASLAVTNAIPLARVDGAGGGGSLRSGPQADRNLLPGHGPASRHGQCVVG